jgi:hypothetical protein
MRPPFALVNEAECRPERRVTDFYSVGSYVNAALASGRACSMHKEDMTLLVGCHKLDPNWFAIRAQ